MSLDAARRKKGLPRKGRTPGPPAPGTNEQHAGHPTPAATEATDWVSMASLMTMDLPEPKPIVPGLIYFGLNLISGRPKRGKSWLVFMSCLAIAAGRMLFGAQVDPRPVLYLSLEDRRSRLKARGGMLLKALGLAAAPAALTLGTRCPRLSAGGLVKVAEWLSANRGGVVVIDTLVRFRDPPRGRGDTYSEDDAALAALKQVADEYGGAIVVIHHTRKAVDQDDPFANILGSTANYGAPDMLVVLDRKQPGSPAARVYCQGRDAGEQTLFLRWDPASLWALDRTEDGIITPTDERESQPNKVGRCAEWLRSFLGDYAWPDNEVVAAAKDADFTFDNVKKAKAALRTEDPPLSSRADGAGGRWWNWVGSKADRKPSRPTPYTSGKMVTVQPTPHTPTHPHTHGTPHTPQTGLGQCGEGNAHASHTDPTPGSPDCKQPGITEEGEL